MAQLALEGASLGYEEAGSGSPVFVFLHGWACDRTFWAPQAADLARDHRCISIDFRGRGESSRTAPYHAAQTAEDTIAAIESLQAGPAVLVGHSLGGLIALLVNDRRPELVSGIVLGDSPLEEQFIAGYPKTAQRIREAGSMDPLARWVDSLFVESTPEAVREKVRTTMLGCDPEVAAGMLDGNEVFLGRLDDLVRAADRKPFMAIWAGQPMGNPVHLRDITVFLRQEPIAAAGHFFQLEQPAITNALLRAFEDDVRRDPRLEAGS